MVFDFNSNEEQFNSTYVYQLLLSTVLLQITLLTIAQLLLVLPMPMAKATNGLRVPTFIQEPPPRLLFSNDTGTQVSCTAHGNPPPVVSWVLSDGTMATQVPGLSSSTSSNGGANFLVQFACFNQDICKEVIITSSEEQKYSHVRGNMRSTSSNAPTF
uniref:Ig-like domain-containing protein n=1 Tax=Glossina austeni TaxID=7395 RepID=A0A1A9UEN8_GLOAU